MSDTEKSSKKTSSKKERVVGELSPIATPLAGKKLTKNLYKVVKKGMFGHRFTPFGSLPLYYFA